MLSPCAGWRCGASSGRLLQGGWIAGAAFRRLVAEGRKWRIAVRWILENRDRIDAEIDQWHSLIWINSNRQMDLWINDADPVYFLAKADQDGKLDLARVHVGATQS